MFESVKKYCEDRIDEFDQIPKVRKKELEKVSQYLKEHKNAHLIFVCTHNSRRSHFGQVWAIISAKYYGLVSAHYFSAGTEYTAFHPNAIEALVRAGIRVERSENTENPDCFLDFGGENSIKCFSKSINHESLPKSNFAAIMTCDHAEENCPFLPGADLRISLTYEDPKISDGTSRVEEIYDERCAQIAREVFYFSSKSVDM
jgi:protein-tyrosine-phosphatase